MNSEIFKNVYVELEVYLLSILNIVIQPLWNFWRKQN